MDVHMMVARSENHLAHIEVWTRILDTKHEMAPDSSPLWTPEILTAAQHVGADEDS